MMPRSNQPKKAQKENDLNKKKRQLSQRQKDNSKHRKKRKLNEDLTLRLSAKSTKNGQQFDRLDAESSGLEDTESSGLQDAELSGDGEPVSDRTITKKLANKPNGNNNQNRNRNNENETKSVRRSTRLAAKAAKQPNGNNNQNRNRNNGNETKSPRRRRSDRLAKQANDGFNGYQNDGFTEPDFRSPHDIQQLIQTEFKSPKSSRSKPKSLTGQNDDENDDETDEETDDEPKRRSSR